MLIFALHNETRNGKMRLKRDTFYIKPDGVSTNHFPLSRDHDHLDHAQLPSVVFLENKVDGSGVGILCFLSNPPRL